MSVPNDSSRRDFFCHESLWQAYVDLARHRGTSVDALINDAMGQYLRTLNAGQPYASSAPLPDQAYHASQAPEQAHARRPANHQAQSVKPSPSIEQARRVPPPVPNSNYRRPPSIFEEIDAPAPVVPGAQPLVLASLNEQRNLRAPNYAQSIPQPQGYAQQAQGYAQSQNHAQPPLYIIFANQKYIVDKDKYIIGRSSQLADLVIRDGNVSRKHCAIIFKHGVYYITDLDSTNGIEYRGSRIETKRIDEGDQFNICEFKFTFTYH